MIITIDGPAGSGKSTAARNLAGALGIACLDTGATYRAVTLLALRSEIDLADETALAELARTMDLDMNLTPHGLQVLLDGDDISLDIRSEAVSEASHLAARSPVVRGVLVDLQRRIGGSLGSFVAEGRDQGTVVFPDADTKFFLTASPDVRARRRVEQLAAQGETAEVDQVRQRIIDRDRRDSTRSIAPLKPADDAIHLCTDGQTPDETLATLLSHVKADA
ncbi:MAG: (d)CMP kinase [Planctomycetes bacterium]|jgi:cytidylate kinase|nr:(d)CMP kinase [Phycisphaerae bacterium]NBB94437.1 (d)CMP kinase [Planctomycetota bacterium]